MSTAETADGSFHIPTTRASLQLERGSDASVDEERPSRWAAVLERNHCRPGENDWSLACC